MSLTYRVASTSQSRLAAMSVRYGVFVIEQRVPVVLEIDARDFLSSTTHLLATTLEGPVGAARLLAPTCQSEFPEFHVGRVAVLEAWRGRGIGRDLMKRCEDAARRQVRSGAPLVLVLDAQVQAEAFYKNLGYLPTGRPRFMDAGILHQEMAKRTTGSRVLSE